jgi:hypothetical protein
MFDDVKKMIEVRKREGSVLALSPEREPPKLMAVPCRHDIPAPVPYIRWNQRSAIVVAANRSTRQDVQLRLRIPLGEIGLAGHSSYRVADLWPGGDTKTCLEKDLEDLACTVKPDKTAGGGLQVLKIEPNF